jgi:hypothetical protein
MARNVPTYIYFIQYGIGKEIQIYIFIMCTIPLLYIVQNTILNTGSNTLSRQKLRQGISVYVSNYD